MDSRLDGVRQEKKLKIDARFEAYIQGLENSHVASKLFLGSVLRFFSRCLNFVLAYLIVMALVGLFGLIFWVIPDIFFAWLAGDNSALQHFNLYSLFR